MYNIWRVDDYNVDGTRINKSVYYASHQSASNHYNVAKGFASSPVEILVLEEDDVNLQAAREKASAKLTPEEIELLGLK